MKTGTDAISSNDFSILSVIAEQKERFKGREDRNQFYRNLSNFGRDVARHLLNDNPPLDNTNARSTAEALSKFAK